MTGHARSTSRPGWTLSPVVAAAVVVGTLCLVASFLLSRVEPALIAAPLLLAAAWGWERRPRSEDAAVDLHTAVTIDAPPADGRVSVQVGVTASDRPDALHLRLSPQDRPPLDAIVTPAAAAALPVELTVAHSGPQRIVAVTARILGIDAAWASAPGEETAVDQVLRPARRPVRSLPLPARLLGLTGPHLSSRPGDGGEFRDIDLFHPGDRLRRIDWRATARAGR